MADIKTRDVTRGTIKTLDRAASYTHHMKEVTIRSKAAETGNRYDNDSAGSYAQDTVEHYAGDGAAYAAKAGVELLMKSRGKPGSTDVLADIEEGGMLNNQKPPVTATAEPDNAARVQQAFREQGIKTIRGRQSRAKMADEEVFRIAEEDRLTGRVKRASANRSGNLSRYSAGRIAKNRQNRKKEEELVLKRRKEHAIKRITERNAKGGALQRILGIGKGSRRNMDRSGRLLRKAARGTRTLFSTLSIGGAATVVILVIMVLFGSVLSFNEDGSYVLGTGDETIVEVARAQLGNQGGEKFWKWYGFKSRVDWCAIFCSWCADQCGYLEAGTYPRFAVVGDGADWFKERHRWAGRGYTPKPGDLIFFDPEHDGVYNHVGIVESCDGKTITTIEGNSGDACKRHTYPVGSSQIVGFGISIVKSTMPMSGNYSIMQARMVAWAKMIAADNKYSYKTWTSSNRNTDKCPICHPGSGNGWNCIGFVFAVWHHGGGLNNRCDCSAISNGVWESMLTAKSDAQASKIASDRLGIPVVVIRNNGKTIPQSALMPGDILGHYHGGTFWHTTFYIGDGKIAHSKSSGSKADQITISNAIDCKVVIRYAGAPQSKTE